MNKNFFAFLLILLSLLSFKKNFKDFLDRKIESYIFYPYLFLYNEIHSFFYIRKEKIEGLKFSLRKKENVPIFVNFPLYYDNFPYPENIIIKGKGEKGDVVVSKAGLVGKVVEKNGDLLKVITIFNKEFKCSLISKYNILSLYQGTGELRGIVNFYPTWGELKKGDTLYTSGLTENFPKNIPAFIVDSFVEKKGEIFYEIYVRPVWRPEKYEFYYTIPPKP
ncbi:MAG: rod shape-determining protein MreC [candidate division WOR-3 bacterium]